MARVVVIGGGLGGLASAARLAKLGHEVTLLEQSDRLGGALAPYEHEGHRWDGGHTLLPAVLRDLFRKSGRPLEREAELVALPHVREHRFADDSRLLLPGGSRADQLAAFDDLGPGLGRTWCAYVDECADDWELLRRDYLERPWSPDVAPRATTRLLHTRQSLHRRVRRALPDPRQRLVAGFPAELGGQRLRDLPAWAGMTAYLEQAFGAWTLQGGLGTLADLLAQRLGTRRVQVRTGTAATDLVVRAGRVVAVTTAAGPVDADVVVVAVDPRRLPALAPYVARTMPALPPTTTHLGLSGDVPDLTHETVLHGDPTIVVRTGGAAPDGGHTWTLHARGRIEEDLVTTLVRYGVDVRDRVRVRVDRSPRELVEAWGGSPEGVLWQGRGTVSARLGPRTPVAGVYAAGAHATPGAGVPFVGLSAALVAQVVGPA